MSMSELSNIVFYFLSTVAQVYAAILGFFIVGQLYIYQVSKINKVKSKDGRSVCASIFVLPSFFGIYMLLFAIILFSTVGILLNIESIFGIYILAIPMLVFGLSILAIKKLYSYLKILESFNEFVKRDEAQNERAVNV